MATPIQVVIDCANPVTLAPFWAEMLGYVVQPPPPGFDTWEAFLEANDVPKERWDSASAIIDPDGNGARIFFQKVPEPKTVKNRVHVDVNAGGPRSAPEDERRAKVATAVERAT